MTATNVSNGSQPLLINSNLEIPATSGSVKICKAKDLFNYYIQGFYKSVYLNINTKPTAKTSLMLYECDNSASTFEMFETFPRDLEELVLTQGQIVECCRSHKEILFGNKKIESVCFLLMDLNNELSVCEIHSYPDGLAAYLSTKNHTRHGDGSLNRFIVVPNIH